MATKPFLKWAGGKTRVAPHILPHLQGHTRLVEPFAGSCALFLQSEFKDALLTDINPDLIRLFKTLQTHGEDFINWLETRYFDGTHNTKDAFMENRAAFNARIGLDPNDVTQATWERSGLFVYLNRHAFNGMCRYNKSGGYNVPFGKYKSPYFPKTEMLNFVARTTSVTFKCQSFTQTMEEEIAAPTPNTVIYCDPPYIELSKTASFAAYATDGFDLGLQEKLATLSWQAAQQGLKTLVSNHDVGPARNLYERALNFAGDMPLEETGPATSIASFNVRRSISAKGSQRGTAPELLAIYDSKIK